jgi:FixJ family two-component response regulator
LEQHESRRATRAADEGLRKRLDLLTPQQREVFERIVVGKLNKQIAHELGVSERTVKTRRAEIMERLDADSVAELGRQAEQLRRLSKGDGGT